MDNIHKEHRARMREKYRKHGPDQFEPHQLTEMLLFWSMRQGDTNPAAHNILNICDCDPFDASRQRLCEADGIGEKSAELLKISCDTAVRLLEETLKREPMVSEFSRQMYLWLWFRDKGAGTVGVLLLDKRDCFVDCAVIARGRLERPEDYFDVLYSLMRERKAAKAVLCHNHKNGSKTPSVEDVYLTGYLEMKLAQQNFALEAHYIVTGSDCVRCEMK